MIVLEKYRNFIIPKNEEFKNWYEWKKNVIILFLKKFQKDK